MASNFRFLVICQSATKRSDDDFISLNGIVNDIETRLGESLEVTVVVGLVLFPEMKGRHLDLMAWKSGKNGEPLVIPGYVGTPLILPHGMGPVALPLTITLPIRESGVHGFFLFDREGTFGPKESLLATYVYGVKVV